MTRPAPFPVRHYSWIAVVMLTAGLAGALVIYLTAGSPGENSMVSEFEGSKRFIHDLELYGGKANVIADRLTRWFDGLWRGKSLAFTVAFISAAVSAGYFLLARQLASHEASGSEEESRREDAR